MKEQLLWGIPVGCVPGVHRLLPKPQGRTKQAIYLSIYRPTYLSIYLSIYIHVFAFTHCIYVYMQTGAGMYIKWKIVCLNAWYSVCACMHVYIHTYMHACMHACLHTDIIHTGVFIDVHYFYMYMHVCIDTLLCAFTYVHVCIHMYTHILAFRMFSALGERWT